MTTLARWPAADGDVDGMAATHLAHHHPQLLGAAGPEVLQQMAEEVPGARPGQ